MWLTLLDLTLEWYFPPPCNDCSTRGIFMYTKFNKSVQNLEYLSFNLNRGVEFG